jgi:hypothetical protein
MTDRGIPNVWIDSAGELTVVHKPNLSSGGQQTRTPVKEFLEIGRAGPEHEALRAQLKQREAAAVEKSMDAVTKDCPL